MPLVVKTIGSAGGRDYSSLAAWAASLPADLVAAGNSYRGECYNDSEFTGSSTLLSLSGHTTDANHTITLTTGVGQSFRDNANVQTNALRYNAANGVAITSSVGYSSGTISISDGDVFLSNLQVRNTASNGTAIIAQPASNVSVTIDDCVIANTGGSRGPMMGSLQTTIRNSLLYATGGPPWVIDGGSTAGSGFPSCHFCTIVSPSDAPPPPEALHGLYSTGALKNCAFFGCTAIAAGSSTFTFTNCMTDVASPPSGVTGGKTYGNQFQNTTAASSDFREKSGADLQGAAAADGTNGATDIVGTPRPQSAKWDIGCWELLAPGTLVAVAASVPIEHLPMQRVHRTSGVEFIGSQRVAPRLDFEATTTQCVDLGLMLGAMAMQRADPRTPLGWLALQSSPLGLPVELGRRLAIDTAGCVESLARAFVDRRLAAELLILLLRNVSASSEFATAVSRGGPAPADWLSTIAALLTADAIPPIEWSALPSPVQVSVERLLASPGKRRLLGTPGRLRLLKRR